MNFPQFGVGVPLTAALPVATQFTAAGKITQSVTTANGQVVGVLQGGENGVHYIRPLDANAFTTATAQGQNGGGTGGAPTQTLITLPITMPGAKPGDPQQHVQIQVVNPPVTQGSPEQSPKYHISQIPIQTFGQGATVLTVAYNPNQEGIQIVDGQNGIAEGMTVVAALQPQDIQLIPAEPDKGDGKDVSGAGGTGGAPVALIKTEYIKDEDQPQTTPASNQQSAPQPDGGANAGGNAVGAGGTNGGVTAAVATIPAQYLQNANVQEYLQKFSLQQTSLPLSLQQFLKFNNTEIKRESTNDDGNGANVLEAINITTESGQQLILNEVDGSGATATGTAMDTEEAAGVGEGGEKNGKKKKKYKKKPPKPKKPKPGQVHIATALDGTTLFCCPECHMAYPEKELLEQHLVGHKIERRFICDHCGAGLKRKEHLERHKLGHSPERPFVCSVCMKGFKRKEHLNLHFVIHSGEKTEICNECGKGFYRKDHLRKHSRSHITRRAKEQAERQNLLLKEAGAGNSTTTTTTTTQVTIQVPTSQMQIPVQIQVPQHHIQVTANNDEENNQVSTVVLPAASEGITILPN